MLNGRKQHERIKMRCALRAAHSQPWRVNSVCPEHGKLQAYRDLKRMTRDFGVNRLDRACERAIRLGATRVPSRPLKSRDGADASQHGCGASGGNAHPATKAIDQIEAPGGAP